MVDEKREHPVLTGLVALVSVGLAVGLIVGGITLAATRIVGVDGSSATGDSSGRASLYLPRPIRTTEPSGALITLSGQPSPSSTATSDPSFSTSASDDPTDEDGQISLSAGQTEVAPMGQIDLSGIYPGGEGAILQVEKFTDGTWQEFPVTAVVSNETFSTYVQTSFIGINRFRVVDADGAVTSNEVRVTVG